MKDILLLVLWITVSVLSVGIYTNQLKIVD